MVISRTHTNEPSVSWTFRLVPVGSAIGIVPKTLDRPGTRESAGVVLSHTHAHEPFPRRGWKFRLFPVALAFAIAPKTLDRPGIRESAGVGTSRTHVHKAGCRAFDLPRMLVHFTRRLRGPTERLAERVAERPHQEHDQQPSNLHLLHLLQLSSAFDLATARVVQHPVLSRAQNQPSLSLPQCVSGRSARRTNRTAPHRTHKRGVAVVWVLLLTVGKDAMVRPCYTDFHILDCLPPPSLSHRQTFSTRLVFNPMWWW